MAPDSQTRKIFLVLLGFTLVLSTVSAAEINLNGDVVWLNGLTDQDEVTVSGENASETELKIVKSGKEPVSLMNGSGAVKTEEFSDLALGDYQLELRNSTGGLIESSEISLRRLNLDVNVNGTGFVDEKIGQVPFTEPVSLTIGIEGGSPKETIQKEEVSIENFDIDNRKAILLSQSDVEKFQRNQEVKVDLYPQVQEKISDGERVRLIFNYEFRGSEVSVDNFFYPDINTFRAQKIGDTPPSVLDYNNIEDFSYNIDLLEDGSQSNKDLFSEEVSLEINEVNDDGTIGSEVNSGKNYLEVNEITGGDADYSIGLTSIPQLATGIYRFTTYLEKGGEKTYIDSIRVRHGLKLSGRVVDSENRGVRTEMNLDREGTVIPINTASDGTYYKEIETSGNQDSYTVTMNFFDREMSSSDAEVTARGVNFAEKDGNNLAGDSESIKFQYWDNPPVEQKAIKPINMMAVKFAYPIADRGHRVRMKFDPTDVNTDNLKVYGCNQWNFEGRTCLGEWEVVEDFIINYQGWRANFHIDDPYRAQDTGDGGQNILMNAYIIGTSADLVLNGGLSISGPEGGTVATGSQIEVSGNINSENENAVEGANVEVSFYQGDTEVSILDTVQTDITGRFVAKGAAPEEPGNYSVRVTADKENYNIMEKKFDNRFETVIEEGIAVRTGSTVEISPGEDVTSEVTVQNTGQTSMDDVSFSFEGLDSQYYSVSDVSYDQIPAGEERTTEVTISLPSDYCDGGCGDWPTLDISATATNPDGEEFEADTETLQVQISRTTTGQSNSDSSETGQATSETDDTNESGSSFTQSVSELENATGEFLASQSSLNMALGLIMVFMMVLAGAVKKQDNGRGAGRRSSRSERNGRDGRPRVQKPNVAVRPDVEQAESDKNQKEVEDVERHVESHAEAITNSVSEEESEERPHVKHVESEDQKTSQEDGIAEAEVVEKEDGEKKFVCEETGEEFDTETALRLHKKMNGLI